MNPPVQEQKTKTSAGMETVDETVKRAQAMVNPTVSADELVNPPARVEPPAPQLNTNDGSRTSGIIGNVAAAADSFITSQSEEAAKAKELAGLLGSQTFDGAGERDRLNTEFGLPDNLARLKDIQTQLAQRNTDSKVTQSRIAGGAGQTLAQGQREITQEQREAAIRDAGLAAEAAVLQGNIKTASTLVSQAMSDFYSDRQLKNQNIINQLNYFQGIADEQTKQLIEKEKRAYEADQKLVERVKTAVDNALMSGAASTKEMAMLTNPKTTDAERLALAQLIQGRGAKEIRDLETHSARMDLTIKAQQLAKLREPVVATRETSVVDVNGTKQLIDTQTGEVIATFGVDVSVDDIEKARDVQFVNTVDTLKNHPGMSKAVGTSGLARWTPFKVDTMDGDVSDFVGSVENTVKMLTLNTFEEAKAKGMTFGAMSQGEWEILGQAATKIVGWRRERDDGSVYYETSEKNMNSELDLISNFAKMDSLRKGVDPSSIGVLKQDDGTYWTKNSDGTYTQLEVTAQ